MPKCLCGLMKPLKFLKFIRHTSHLSTVALNYTLWEETHTVQSAPPIVIMHALLGSSDNWREAARRIVANCSRRIYTVDARNHGNSPHCDEHSSAHMAADVAAMMEKLGITKIVAMGHSMGGRAMMSMALMYPQLVERAIIVDVSPISLPGSLLTSPSLLEFMTDLIDKIPKDLTLGNARRYVTPLVEEEVGTDMDIQLIVRNLRKAPSGEFMWAVNVRAIRNSWYHFSNYLETVKALPPYMGPVLFIAGTHSGFFKESDIPEIKKIFPNLSVDWLDAGHVVHFDQPDQFLQSVVRFVQL